MNKKLFVTKYFAIKFSSFNLVEIDFTLNSYDFFLICMDKNTQILSF